LSQEACQELFFQEQFTFDIQCVISNESFNPKMSEVQLNSDFDDTKLADHRDLSYFLFKDPSKDQWLFLVPIKGGR